MAFEIKEHVGFKPDVKKTTTGKTTKTAQKTDKDKKVKKSK